MSAANKRILQYGPRTYPALLAFTLVVLIAAPIVFAATHALWPRLIAVLALTWWMPGVLLVPHLRLPDLDVITAGLLALALGACWIILVALLVHWFPGPITFWPFVGMHEAGLLFLLVALLWRRPTIVLTRPSTSVLLWMLVLLVLTSLLRLPGLGYRELHNDETEVLYVARNAIQGHDDAFARHTKGPGELAITLTLYRSLGSLNETTGRLPFALAGIAAVLATAVLGMRLFSPAVGVWAGILLALNGYVLALSRLIQYHPFVLLLMALAVLAGWEFAQNGDRRWLTLLLAFAGFGLVLHYEFILLAPAVLFLLWHGWRRAPHWNTLRTFFVAGGLATLLPFVSYARLLLHPEFADRTGAGWQIRFGQIGAFNVPFFVDLSTLYNSTYYFVGLLLLVAVGLVFCLHLGRRRTYLLALWFLPFLLLYLFVLRLPGTHFYMMMESWSLLAALPLAVLAGRDLLQPVFRWVAIVLIVGWLALSTGYLYLAFFQEDPEYVMNYPRVRSPLYWAPYGEDIPQAWRFGFPILSGWKVLGVLNEWHYVGDTYAANDASTHLRWYLGGFERVDPGDRPDFIFMTTQAREPDTRVVPEQLGDYRPVGEVHVRGEPRITIWAREPLGAPFVRYDLEPFATVFDGVVPALEDWPNPSLRVADVTVDERVTLVSAGYEPASLSPGDTLHLHLRWRPEVALTRDYKLFVHVGADEAGRPVAQWDGLPGLNTARTGEWPVGEVFDDHVLLQITADVPPGTHDLRVGLYDGATGERLGDRAVNVGTVTVKE